MLDPAQLAALSAVHRRGSFDLAAAALRITPSAVSQRIRALEDAVGTLLIVRGQPSVATAAGLRLIRHHDEVALLESSLVQDLPSIAVPPATVRIAVNADSLATWFLPALANVSGPLWDLVIDDQNWSEGWLKRGEVAGALTGSPGVLQGCESFPLGRLRYRATASPDFIARWFAQGIDAETLARAPAIAFNSKDRLQHDWAASRTGQTLALPVHHLASSHGFVDAARAGLGWCVNPELLVAPHLASGALVDLGAPLDVALHWQVARRTAAALAPLTRAIRAAASAALLPVRVSPESS